jgi:protein TonB
MVETLIVESAETDPNEETVSEDADVSPDEGTIEDSAPSRAEMETEKDQQTEKAETAGRDKAKPDEIEPRQETKRNSQPSKAAKKGGAQARSKSAKKQSGGQVSASRGAINNYKARVRARIARNRPRGLGARGTPVVSFGVSRSGSLRYARLTRSSGNRSLDSAALSAVRRASPFPTPPRGSSLRELSFNIPFYFR